VGLSAGLAVGFEPRCVANLTDTCMHIRPQPSTQVHGDALISHEQLAGAAERMQRRLRASWRRLDDLLQSTRCVVDFLSNTVG